MSDYPRLREIGIDDPARITGYVINSINRVDILRIRQKRESGSLLPTSRSWEFPRIQQTAPDRERGTVLTTSPVLREIEAELDELLSFKAQQQTAVQAVLEELRALEDEFGMRINHIRQTLDGLQGE